MPSPQVAFSDFTPEFIGRDDCLPRALSNIILRERARCLDLRLLPGFFMRLIIPGLDLDIRPFFKKTFVNIFLYKERR